jgi:hypothetical protein
MRDYIFYLKVIETKGLITEKFILLTNKSMKTHKIIIPCLMALLFTGIHNQIKAQIVYTDLSDTTIFIPNVPKADTSNKLYVDIDNNGINDFIFNAEIFYDYNVGHPIIGKVLGILPSNSCNFCKVDGGCFNNFTLFLFNNDTIDSKNTWANFGDVIFYQTNIPYECTEPPLIDFYFGLKLVKNADTLYGWVKCSATDSSITIKDYAYNSVANQYILAGQTISGIDTDSLNTLIHIYTRQRMLIVDLKGITGQGDISIINLMGQTLQTTAIIANHSEIRLNSFAQGVYIVRVSTPTVIVNKKMYLY